MQKDYDVIHLNYINPSSPVANHCLYLKGGVEVMSNAHVHEHEVFLTPSEVASSLGVSPNTVTRWAREGRMPYQMTLGGHRRFDAAVIQELRRHLQERGSVSADSNDVKFQARSRVV
jgi:excisionase family DNA binding protein